MIEKRPAFSLADPAYRDLPKLPIKVAWASISEPLSDGLSRRRMEEADTAIDRRFRNFPDFHNRHTRARQRIRRSSGL
jgi:hypothetical protein